jgi:hypothetical protein
MPTGHTTKLKRKRKRDGVLRQTMGLFQSANMYVLTFPDPMITHTVTIPIAWGSRIRYPDRQHPPLCPLPHVHRHPLTTPYTSPQYIGTQSLFFLEEVVYPLKSMYRVTELCWNRLYRKWTPQVLKRTATKITKTCHTKTGQKHGSICRPNQKYLPPSDHAQHIRQR